jgi:hypothetical protein
MELEWGSFVIRNHSVLETVEHHNKTTTPVEEFWE